MTKDSINSKGQIYFKMQGNKLFQLLILKLDNNMP